ncbi:LysM peptidoglycan-binding domain-containing protein [Undibacterium curvum]|uniref:LysM peptidoglycan-binding domain-containing protein n=1 Tax=Undibacterium curvum TaxID=2762294 RepID=A0ABR7A028_9BURK|nr:LysM peptidoglycan-binding domain-containing protein [Undibacterium curvum]MBC3930234.1 LysM peptidoglycan-binding domain-containing protein [Undibacterium curvum]
MQQGSDTVYSLLINDEVIGSSNTKDPGKDSINQSYQSAMALGAGTTNSTYVIRQGDSFAGIAKAVWGDSSLWYLIADANHLQDDSLKVGTVFLSCATKPIGRFLVAGSGG